MHSASHQPIVVPPGEGTVWQVLGEIMTRKIASGETGGAYAIVEEVTPPRAVPFRGRFFHRRGRLVSSEP